MGLTKPRAAQIYNLDYKQSTRVVTVANVTLSGGAPATVDGVTLSLNDRILVTGQSTASQNGLYYVTTVGSGSNGTWARTSDGNETGEIEAGLIVMVTAGNIYADTQWKLTTDDPITVGSTALTFVQNYSANSISGGTSNVAVFSNANVTVSSAGTANVLTVSSTGTVTAGTASATGNITGGNVLTAGLISATGNVTGNYFLGNVFFANGITASKIYNGTSEVNVVSSGGNVNVSVGGTANVVVFSSTGQFTNGIVSATGNITGGNISATNHTGTTVSVTANVTGGNVLTGGLISATGNITGGNILGGANVNATTHTGTTVSVTANVTGGNVLTGGLISATGNVTGGNIRTGGLISATGDITANSVSTTNNGAGTNFKVGDDTWLGDINVADTLSIRGQQSAANAYIVFGNADGTQLGRAGSGPLTYGGAFSAVGNITGNFIYGNGAFLTGIVGGGGGGSAIANGATNISIPVASGNITMSVGGQSNTVVVNLGSLTMYGAFAGPKMLEANVSVANAVNGVIFGPVTVGNNFNITVPDASTVYIYSGT
jgi:hypothetical protein